MFNFYKNFQKYLETTFLPILKNYWLLTTIVFISIGILYLFTNSEFFSRLMSSLIGPVVGICFAHWFFIGREAARELNKDKGELLMAKLLLEKQKKYIQLMSSINWSEPDIKTYDSNIRELNFVELKSILGKHEVFQSIMEKICECQNHINDTLSHIDNRNDLINRVRIDKGETEYLSLFQSSDIWNNICSNLNSKIKISDQAHSVAIEQLDSFIEEYNK